MIKLMELCLRWQTFNYNFAVIFIYFSAQVSEPGGKMVKEEGDKGMEMGVDDNGGRGDSKDFSIDDKISTCLRNTIKSESD